MTQHRQQQSDTLIKAGLTMICGGLAGVNATHTLRKDGAVGAKLSQIREIKEHIDRFHDALQRQADKELEASKHTNVVYVNFNKGRKV